MISRNSSNIVLTYNAALSLKHYRTQHTCSLEKVENFLRIQKLLLLNTIEILVTKATIKHNVALVLTFELALSCVKLSATPRTVALQAPLSMGILQARILEWVAMPSCRVLLDPGIKPRSPHCRWILHHLSHQRNPRILEWEAYSFSREPPNPGNEPGLLCCKLILHQLSYQGSPILP